MSTGPPLPRWRIVSGEPCPMLAQVDHIALATDDIERARGFYRLVGAMVRRADPSE
jgi:hypothetical protein